MLFREWRLFLSAKRATLAIRRSHTNANGILVAHIYRFLGVNDVAVGCAVDVFLLNVKVAAGFLRVVSIN